MDYKFKKRVTFADVMDAHTRVITFIIKMTHTRASKNKNKNRDNQNADWKKNEKAMGVVEASFHTTTKNVVQLKYSNK